MVKPSFSILAFSILAFLLSFAVVACSSGSATAPVAKNGGNGVDDVQKACVLQAAWTQPTTSDCVTCVISVGAAACTCDPDPDRGACVTQADARNAEADCTTAVQMCVDACANGDCACTNACYTDHPACRAAESALSGCTVAVCTPHCQ